MPYRQPEETLPLDDVHNTRLTRLWLFPTNSPLKKISTKEESTGNSLPPLRSQQYKHARGYVRFALSKLLKMDPLAIPLDSSPGGVPKLGNNLGYISFSHCSDQLLVGWSPKKIGVDIERSIRSFSAELIANRFFNKNDKAVLKGLDKESLRLEVLNQWVTKEALIKWQRGKLGKDLSEWIILRNSDLAFHQTLKYKVNIFTATHKDWILSIACNQKINKKNLIIVEN